MTEDVAALAARYGLVPLPAEGGLYRRTWAGPPDETGRPAGSAIMVLYSAADELFSALHRLPIDEVWHFYRGDPLHLLLLDRAEGARVVVLGHEAGQHVQFTVAAGTWMGARVAPGGQWALAGTTMAPGFVPADYQGADADALCADYPDAEPLIRALCRPGAPRRMADD